MCAFDCSEQQAGKVARLTDAEMDMLLALSKETRIKDKLKETTNYALELGVIFMCSLIIFLPQK